MKRLFTLYLFVLFFSGIQAQQQKEISHLLDNIAKTTDSRLICERFSAHIAKINDDGLKALAGFFNDKSPTIVYSECNKRNLTRGELAIIVGDLRELMPYATLTGVQNCTLTFCENNPNNIEYYLYAIERMGTEEFSKRYLHWLHSKDRKKWPKGSRCLPSENN